jgi:heme/copper-type cytochrome/quinol oxidase subunit 2
MENYNSSPLMAMLVISIIFIAVCFITIKFRDYFSKVNTLPSWPVVVKSALFWGGVLLIICLGCALWATLYSIKGFEYFMLVPIAAFIGGVYGFVFDWKMRKKISLQVSQTGLWWAWL